MEIATKASAPLYLPVEVPEATLRLLRRHLPQGLQDWAEAERDHLPGTVRRAEAIDSAFTWGIAGSRREVLALALEAVNARLAGAESALATRTG
jgi:hypothetical protein